MAHQPQVREFHIKPLVSDDRARGSRAVELAEQENDLLGAFGAAALTHELERQLGVEALRHRDVVCRLIHDAADEPDAVSGWVVCGSRHGI
jgi:hypothetical protein